MEIRYLRRLYYDAATGEVLGGFYREGDIIFTPAQDDFALYGFLAGRTEADAAYFEWLEPDHERDSRIDARAVSADISKTPPELIYTNQQEEQA